MSPVSPLLRISAGLVVLTCSILLLLDLLGFVPRQSSRGLERRLQTIETLGAQVLPLAGGSDLRAFRVALQTAVERNPELLSAGLRASDGRLLVAVGDHHRLWQPESPDRSSATHARVGFQKAGRPWATAEFRFAALRTGGFFATLWSRPVVRLLLLLGAAGFVAYWIYMRRTLRYLDPSSVIPARVQTAFDVMAEGVLLLDAEERIVLANRQFAETVGRSAASLMSLRVGDLDWRLPDDAPVSAPAWTRTLLDACTVTGARMLLEDQHQEQRTFEVKSAPVLDGWGNAKGAIVTLDDVTELERKKAELERALAELEKSRDEIRLQNEELEVLARRDPLTGVANRRFWMSWSQRHYEVAKREGRRLCCMMVDIDHFKQVNDSFGHAAGDDVIRRVAEALSATVRATDLVGRYGGEEFCICLPDAPLEPAMAVAERIRTRIDSPGFARVPVTVSLGVASIAGGAESLDALIEQADEALYAAKAGGRNGVVRWGESLTEAESETANPEPPRGSD